ASRWRRRQRQRARFHPLRRSAPAHQFRARPCSQSTLPHPRRSHLQRGHQDRTANPRCSRPPSQRPYRARHRPSPQHHSTCRPHPRLPQRPSPRTRRAPGTPRPARHLLPPLPAPIQRARAASPRRIRRPRPARLAAAPTPPRHRLSTPPPHATNVDRVHALPRRGTTQSCPSSSQHPARPRQARARPAPRRGTTQSCPSSSQHPARPRRARPRKVPRNVAALSRADARELLRPISASSHRRARGAAVTPSPLLLSAGEASGDMYAARLATALKQRADLEIFGMGGPQMRAAGVDIVTDYSEVSVVGITEILSHLPSLIRAMRRLVSEPRRRNPASAILTDFPGFHLRLARKLKPHGVRNIYYICPQFWAWRPWRVRVVRRRFAEALCIFPFEEKFYGDAGVPVKFIGHPLVGAVHASVDRAGFCRQHN